MTAKIFEKIRKYFFTGIATLLPLVLTVYVFMLVFDFSNRLAGKYINIFLYEQYGFSIPGLGLVFLLLFIIAIGFLANLLIGKKTYKFFENVLVKVPFINTVYRPAKELTNFLFDAETKEKFKKVVLVEYPHKENYCIGFVTSEGFEELNSKAEKELISVLVPLAPAPFSGILLYLAEEKVKTLDITIDQAIKLIVSGGVVLPTKE
jgi:uncharacterized membrane protein